MIVWVASFPRSGNTYLRILLNRIYGIETSTIYDVDGVADRVGAELVGAIDRPSDLATLRAGDEVHFIKTHRPGTPTSPTTTAPSAWSETAATPWSRGPASTPPPPPTSPS
jgi:hypothetical protein